MRATITRYLHALKQRRSSDEGFSLIELIVVVAILGILVAIAIPVFGNIQKSAAENALKTIASNAANQIGAQVAASPTAITVDLSNLAKDGVTFTVAGDTGIALTGNSLAGVTNANVNSVCVTAKKTDVADQKSGPGCS